MNLAQQMKDVAKFIEGALTDGTERNHWEVCQLTANQFDLWEDDKFPLWLSFIVAGQMRELGIER